jgi:hypothetical protein
MYHTVSLPRGWIQEIKPVLRIRIEKMRMRMRMRIQEKISMRMQIRMRIRMRMRIHALTELWRPKYWYKKFLKGQSSEILVPFLTYMERPRPDFQKLKNFKTRSGPY